MPDNLADRAATAVEHGDSNVEVPGHHLVDWLPGWLSISHEICNIN